MFDQNEAEQQGSGAQRSSSISTQLRPRPVRDGFLFWLPLQSITKSAVGVRRIHLGFHAERADLKTTKTPPRSLYPTSSRDKEPSLVWDNKSAIVETLSALVNMFKRSFHAAVSKDKAGKARKISKRSFRDDAKMRMYVVDVFHM